MSVKISVAEYALDPGDIAVAARRVGAEITLGPLSSSEDVRRSTEGADALLVTLQPLRKEHIAALSDSVKVIARAGVGLDTIDVTAAAERGIRVVYQPTYAINEVADQAAAMLLASWRRLQLADNYVRTDGWAKASEMGAVRALQDATLGVLGAGRIGRALIKRMAPFVSSVLAWDAEPNDNISGVRWADSAIEVLESSDLITLHLPLMEDTHHLIDAAAIARMQDGVILVNVSRGGLVDENALAQALISGKIAAAGLDVFEHEPLPQQSALREAPNLLLSPHMAWYSVDSSRRLTSWSIEDAVSFIESGEVKNGQLA